MPEGEVSSRPVDTELKFSTSIVEPPVWLDEAPEPTEPDGFDGAADDAVRLTDVRPLLAEADHALERDARRAANDNLGRCMTDVGRSRGRAPVPLFAAGFGHEPGNDQWTR